MPNPERSVDRTAIAAAQTLQRLDTGHLAELRRMETGTGASIFWRLAAGYPDTIGQRHEPWVAIIRILAILTPKGDPSERKPLHDPRRRLGEVLCDGGNPDWPDSTPPRPMLSERRLAQLMAARGLHREVLLERAARAVTRTRQPESGVNVCDIAWTVLDSDRGRTGRRLAESYYRTFDRADKDQEINQEGVKE